MRTWRTNALQIAVVTACLLTCGVAAAAPANGQTYSDVGSRNWARSAIDGVTDQGTSGGRLLDDYSPLFKPEKAISRAQLARAPRRRLHRSAGRPSRRRSGEHSCARSSSLTTIGRICLDLREKALRGTRPVRGAQVQGGPAFTLAALPVASRRKVLVALLRCLTRKVLKKRRWPAPPSCVSLPSVRRARRGAVAGA